jgi:hypothetical protein
MTNIQQVNIWVETGAFFQSITDADIAFRMVAGDGGGRVRTQHARPAPGAAGLPMTRRSSRPSSRPVDH